MPARGTRDGNKYGWQAQRLYAFSSP